MAADKFVLVLTTFPADGDAESLGTTLVEEGLAACVNVLPPMLSIYRWKGVIEKADERQLLIKTTEARTAALEIRLRSLHPYDVPEFLIIRIAGGSPEYLAWLSSSTEGV
ncbi:MAG: divalent-cation tolerance protein CutA [Acidobacteriota bacterium]